MKKYLTLAALLAVAACGSKQDATPAADSVGAGVTVPADTTPVTTDSAGMTTDTSMVRDTASH